MVADKFTSVEFAISSALAAGCKTIWLVMQDYHISLFRSLLGEWAVDCLSGTGWYNHLVPMFYIPLPTSSGLSLLDGNLSLSIMRGVKAVRKLSSMVTTWSEPDVYFVIPPQGIYDVEKVRESKTIIADRNKCFFSYQNKTIKDGVLLPFTINRNFDFQALDQYFTPLTKTSKGREQLKSMTIVDLISQLTFYEWDKVQSFDWFYSIHDWKNYCNFLGSEHSMLIKRSPGLKFRHVKKNLAIIGGSENVEV